MTDRNDQIPGCLIVVLFLLSGWLMVATVRGQPPVDPAVMLARMCVSERSWRTDTNDCAAIYAVVAHRADRRGITLERAMRELSPNLHRGAVGRPWVQHLEGEDPPRGWSGARWTRREGCGESREGECDVARSEDWAATLVEARALLALDPVEICSAPPVSWGSVEDIRRGRARGRTWIEVDCGLTLNRFGQWR